MSSPIPLTVFAAAVLILTTVTARAQDKAKLAREGRSGLKVGETAPRFTLQDQAGKDRSLDEFLKKGKVALVFYRSADW